MPASNSGGNANSMLGVVSTGAASGAGEERPGGKRRRRVFLNDEEARQEKSRKHNEAEVRRRHRLNAMLMELGALVDCKSTHKSAILKAAIERLRSANAARQTESAASGASSSTDNIPVKKERDDFSGESDDSDAAESDFEEQEAAFDDPAFHRIVNSIISRYKQLNENGVANSANVAGNSPVQPPRDGMASPPQGGPAAAGPVPAAAASQPQSTAGAQMPELNVMSRPVAPAAVKLQGFPNASQIRHLLTRLHSVRKRQFSILQRLNSHKHDDSKNITPKSEPDTQAHEHNSHSSPTASASAGTITASSTPAPLSAAVSALSSSVSPLPPAPPAPQVAAPSVAAAVPLPAVIPIDHSHVFHRSDVRMDVVDLNGRILDCNEAFAEFLEYPREVLLDPLSAFIGLTHPDSIPTTLHIMHKLREGGGRVHRALKKYITGSGKVREAWISTWLNRDENGNPATISAILEPADDSPTMLTDSSSQPAATTVATDATPAAAATATAVGGATNFPAAH
jgi:PAS domain S-box-containing protein